MMCAWEDCSILDEVPDSGMKELIDCDGEIMHRFPKEMTENQIRHALAFANRAYAWGVDRGHKDKELEFKRIIGL